MSDSEMPSVCSISESMLFSLLNHFVPERYLFRDKQTLSLGKLWLLVHLKEIKQCFQDMSIREMRVENYSLNLVYPVLIML